MTISSEDERSEGKKDRNRADEAETDHRNLARPERQEGRQIRGHMKTYGGTFVARIGRNGWSMYADSMESSGPLTNNVFYSGSTSRRVDGGSFGFDRDWTWQALHCYIMRPKTIRNASHSVPPVEIAKLAVGGWRLAACD